MTLRHIRLFLAVCETGSVTKAGESLHIAQPSVSLAIKELEEYYKVQLFDRISRKLHLTETGRQFLDYAKYIISTFDELEENIMNFEGQGILRIGASMTIGTLYMPKLIQAFQDKYPHLRIEVLVDNSSVIVDLVINNEVDLGLMIGQAEDQRLQFIPFMEEELVIVAHPDHPLVGKKALDKEQIPDIDWLLREKGSAVREMFDGFLHTNDLHIAPLWESVSNEAVLEGVKAGLGMSVMSKRLVEDQLASGQLAQVRVKDMELRRQLHLIHHRNKYLTKNVTDFIALVTDQYRE